MNLDEYIAEINTEKKYNSDLKKKKNKPLEQ